MRTVQNYRNVRQVNRNNILQNVYFQGPLSRLELCEITGLSPATVGNLINPLISEGLVHEVGYEESRGGRRRVIIEIDCNYGYFLAVDVGRTYVQVNLYDFCLKLTGSHKALLSQDGNSIQHLRNTVTQSCYSLIDQLKLDRDRLIGLGLALPGFVDYESGILRWSPVKEWEGHNVKELFSQDFTAPITVDNGSNAMALAELWFGQGKGAKDMVALILGRGIGSGVISRGKLVRGHGNFAGEWGHTIINIQTGSEGKRKTTSIEDGVNAKLDELLEKKGSALISDPHEELMLIKKLIQQGDGDTMDTVKDISAYLAAGIANLLYLYNPQLLVFCGWIGQDLFKEFLPHIKEYLREMTFSPLLDDLEMIPSEFEEGDSCIGAACIALDRFLHNF